MHAVWWLNLKLAACLAFPSLLGLRCAGRLQYLSKRVTTEFEKVELIWSLVTVRLNDIAFEEMDKRPGSWSAKPWQHESNTSIQKPRDVVWFPSTKQEISCDGRASILPFLIFCFFVILVPELTCFCDLWRRGNSVIYGGEEIIMWVCKRGTLKRGRNQKNWVRWFFQPSETESTVHHIQ